MRESVSARVFDPLWLLTRQWQVGEFQGEDAGMPVLARVRAHERDALALPPRRAARRTRQTQAPRYDPHAMPLEAMVERRPHAARERTTTRAC